MMQQPFPSDLEPYIIGLWRFREAGRPRLWCITYAFRGKYYDVQGQTSPALAYEEMRAALKRLRAPKRQQ